MRTIRFTFVLLAFFEIVSCSKDEFKTEGELMGEKVQQLADTHEISLVTTYTSRLAGSYYYYDKGIVEKEFYIDGQVIKVDHTYYNLGDLFQYKIEKSVNGGKGVIGLYFDVQE